MVRPGTKNAVCLALSESSDASNFASASNISESGQTRTRVPVPGLPELTDDLGPLPEVKGSNEEEVDGP